MRSRRCGPEKCRLAHRHPSIRICLRARRVEGYQEQKQRSALSSTRSECASSLARAHTLSRGRRLDLCQSALPWQDPVYVSNPFPTSHSPCNRASLRPQEQQASADWVAHAAPLTRDIADLERRKCEGRTIATSSHHSQDNLGTLCTSGFRRPAEGTPEGCPDGAAGEILREIESAERCPNWEEAVQGVRGCPKPTLPKSTKCFEVLVSAAGFEPATHALKGHCSTN
jgi:hypothetical protein